MSKMHTSDWIGTLALSAFGLWWVVWPNSVIRFYSKFHADGVTLPRTTVGIRIGGALWILLVGIIVWRAAR